MQAPLVLFLAVAAVAKGVPSQPQGRLNQTEADGGLEAKERYRRLIPYMTFYVGGGNRLNGGAFLRSGQADYRPIVAVAGPADNLIPYLPHQGSPYLQPSALTRMITQNYLAIAKQQIPQTNRYYQQQRPKYYTRGYVRPTEGGSYSRPAAQEPVFQRPQQTSYQRPAEDTSYQKPAEEVQAYQRPAEEVTAYKRPVEEVPTYQRPAEPAVVYQRPLEAYQRPTYQNYHIPEGPRYVARPTNGVAFSAKPSDTSVTITQSQEISVPDTTAVPLPQTQIYQTPNQYYKVEKEKEINSVLDRVELSKALPERITTDNLGSSIKTLSKLLRLLQEAHDAGGELATTANKLAAKIPPSSQEGSTPGRAGIDYPAYTEIPTTRFSCKLQRYKGFFGDPETGCQVWHYCDLNGGQASFLCPNGTIFSQVALTCDWWFNVKCDTTAQLYVLNERLYKYILPHKPSFPEDYAGPLVDSYLRLKFDQIQSNSTAANARQTPDQIDEQEEEVPQEDDEELQEEDE